MDHKQTRSSAEIAGRIDAKIHDVEDLKSKTDGRWADLSTEEKLGVVRNTDPVEEETVYNVTTNRFHEYFVDNLDPGQSGAGANLTPSHLGLGTDSASGTSTVDTDLNSRVFSKTVTDHADNSDELLCSTFVDSTEANGFTLEELGLFTGDPANLANSGVFLINHSTFSAVTKDNSNTVTFDVTLQFSDV